MTIFCRARSLSWMSTLGVAICLFFAAGCKHRDSRSEGISLYLGGESGFEGSGEWVQLNGGPVHLESKAIFTVMNLTEIRFRIVEGAKDLKAIQSHLKSIESFAQSEDEVAEFEAILSFKEEDAQAIAEITRNNVNRILAFTVGDKVLFAPVITMPLPTSAFLKGLKIDLGSPIEGGAGVKVAKILQTLVAR